MKMVKRGWQQKSISGFVGERAASTVAVRAQREGAAGDSRCRAL